MRGRGGTAGAYLVDDGLGKCLTHTAWFLQGLPGEEGGEMEVVQRVTLRGHVFVSRHSGPVWGSANGKRERMQMSGGGRR